MKRFAPAILLCSVMIAAGCSSTTMQTNPVNLGGARLARPGRIIVYNFAASSADLRPEEQGGMYVDPSNQPSAQQLAIGRQLGAKVAQQIVAQVNEMGMTAVVGDNSAPHIGDIVIEGHFESVDEGNAAKRVALGFGSGKAELRTVVVGYVMTDQGLRRVGSGTVDSAGGKGPGLFVPVVVLAATANPIGLIVSGAAKVEGEASGRTTIDGAAKRTASAISDRMKVRFEQEGWI